MRAWYPRIRCHFIARDRGWLPRPAATSYMIGHRPKPRGQNAATPGYTHSRDCARAQRSPLFSAGPLGRHRGGDGLARACPVHARRRDVGWPAGQRSERLSVPRLRRLHTRTLALQDTRMVELYEGRHPTVVGVLLRTVIGAGIGAGAGYVTGRESSRNCHGDLCGIGGAVAPALLAIGGGAVGFVYSLALPPARWRQIWP